LQEAKYLYTSPIDASLRTAVVYPDSTDVVAQDPNSGDCSITTDNADHTSTAYHLLGQTATATDQRGVVHSYTYDSAGRLSADEVTNFGRTDQNVDQTINEPNSGDTTSGIPGEFRGHDPILTH
jgi:YD repeat-containing protein